MVPSVTAPAQAAVATPGERNELGRCPWVPAALSALSDSAGDDTEESAGTATAEFTSTDGTSGQKGCLQGVEGGQAQAERQHLESRNGAEKELKADDFAKLRRKIAQAYGRDSGKERTRRSACELGRCPWCRPLLPPPRLLWRRLVSETNLAGVHGCRRLFRRSRTLIGAWGGRLGRLAAGVLGLEPVFLRRSPPPPHSSRRSPCA